MKKITTLAVLLTIAWQATSQSANTSEIKKHELKVDVAYLLDATMKAEYEYLLNDWSSLGAVAFYNFSSNPYFKSEILGLYRLYFGKEPSKGFFLEGNCGLLVGNLDYYYGNNNSSKQFSAFGAGVALGWKWFIPKSDIVLDLFVGVNRAFTDEFFEAFPRVGICIGKRF